jgi:pyruvate kinase
LIVAQRTNLYWGVHPVKCPPALSAEHMVSVAEKELLDRRLLKPGDVLGVVAGTRQSSGSTNLMRLHTVTPEEVTAGTHTKAKRGGRLRKL